MSCPHGYPNEHACRKCRNNKSEYRPLYKDVIKRWTPEQIFEWEERAAIISEGCKIPMEQAELEAFKIVAARWDE